MDLSKIEKELLNILFQSKEGRYKALNTHLEYLEVKERKFDKGILKVIFEYKLEQQLLIDEIPLEAL